MPPAEGVPAPSAPRPTLKPKHRRPFVIPEFLPEQRIEHALPQSERPCGCCGEERVVINEHVTRQIELTPAQAHVEVHVRYTYACKHCRSGEQVVTTAKPPAPIEKSPFGASLLAWIISSKFERHLPTYRHQEMLLAPLGLWLSRPLLCQLLKGSARALKPLAERLLREILLSYVLMADETKVRYLGGQPGKSLLGYLFGYGGDADHQYLWYDFRPHRGREGPREVLGDFRGVLLTDGFSGYESLASESQGRLTAAACWMHARRRFDEALYTTSHVIVEETLARIGLLYDMEEGAKGLSFEARGTLRGRKHGPWWNVSLPVGKKYGRSCVRHPSWPRQLATRQSSSEVIALSRRWPDRTRHRPSGAFATWASGRTPQLVIFWQSFGWADGGHVVFGGAKCSPASSRCDGVSHRRAASAASPNAQRRRRNWRAIAGSLGQNTSPARACRARRRIVTVVESASLRGVIA